MVIEESIIHRYLILSVLASTLPVLAIGLVYNHFAGSALEQMLGEKTTTHLTATSNRLAALPGSPPLPRGDFPGRIGNGKRWRAQASHAGSPRASGFRASGNT